MKNVFGYYVLLLLGLISSLTYAQKSQIDLDKKLSPFKKNISEMVFVKGSIFWMGSKDNDRRKSVWEKPRHLVKVSSFAMSKYEITVAQYKVFVKETGVKMRQQPKWSSLKHPVVNIEWKEAIAYCNWLSKKTGYKLRLPTEAEWEFAARGGKTEGEFEYSGSNKIDDVAWYYSNSNDVKNYKELGAHPVGLKKPNRLGIYDLSGNVWELCMDIYSLTFYKQCKDKGVVENPVCLSDSKFISHTMRGGSWSDDDYICTPAFRQGISWYTDHCGFRIVLELE